MLNPAARLYVIVEPNPDRITKTLTRGYLIHPRNLHGAHVKPSRCNYRLNVWQCPVRHLCASRSSWIRNIVSLGVSWFVEDLQKFAHKVDKAIVSKYNMLTYMIKMTFKELDPS